MRATFLSCSLFLSIDRSFRGFPPSSSASRLGKALMVCFRIAGASLREMDRSFRQMEPGVNFVENDDAVKKITLYQALNQSQAQKSSEQ
jgi:hypothetical protein